MKAIVILSGGIKKDAQGAWHSTDLTEADNKLSGPGGYLRVLAAKYLLDEDVDWVIVSSGGLGGDVKERDPAQPLICDIIKDELLALGVVESRIMGECDSNNTLEQIEALSRLIKENDWKEVVAVTGRFHLPRAKAMAEKESGLAEFFKRGKIKFLSAEDILMEKEPQQWSKLIDNAYGSDWMARRLALEKKGEEDFKAGRYNIKK